ncbi:hypothetical protein KC19_VG315800, partial [Ceratodon purpureus]
LHNIEFPYVIPETFHRCSGPVTCIVASEDKYKDSDHCPPCRASVYGHVGESRVPTNVLRHLALAPRLRMMFKSPNSASYMMGPNRLGRRDNELLDDMPALETSGIYDIDDEILGDMPPLETTESITAVYIGLHSLLKCDPSCQLCVVTVPSDGVLVLDKHFTWLRHCFDSAVAMLVLHLLLRKSGISKTAFFELFRIIFMVHVSRGIYSEER